MKTSAVLTSLLFGAFSVAAPLDPRRLVHKTQVVTETVIVYTTVYEDTPVAQATTTAGGYFYEQPSPLSSVAAVTSSSAAVVASSSQAPAYTAPPPPESKPTSTYVAPPPPPPPQVPTPAPTSSPAPVNTPPPVETPAPVATPQPATSAAYVPPAPAPAAPSPPPAASTYPASTSSTGDTYSGVDITVYDNNGGFGACGTALHDDDMIVALSAGLYGASSYNIQTGAATNPWCGQKIKIDYNGNSVVATIMDLCPGCIHAYDIDLSVGVWKALTGLEEKTRLQASWSKIA